VQPLPVREDSDHGRPGVKVVIIVTVVVLLLLVSGLFYVYLRYGVVRQIRDRIDQTGSMFRYPPGAGRYAPARTARDENGRLYYVNKRSGRGSSRR
jgi:hypothetical protein